MSDDAFLTDRRREILDGATADDMDIASATHRQHRAAIKRQSRAALNELTQVAQSVEISNHDVFNPETIGTLLFYILRDPVHVEPPVEGGLVEPPEDVQNYRNAVVGQLFRQAGKYGEFDVGRFDPDE
jgi:hypothetical protein